MAKKKKGTYIGFAKLTKQLERKGVRNPRAVSASIGRKKYGKKGFAALRGKGRKKR